MIPLPHIQDHLPELMDFLADLDAQTRTGQLSHWDTSISHILNFYTPEVLAKMEAVVPHWGQMTAYGNGITCAHVMLVLLSMLQLPEYQAATAEQQSLALWIGLFHDVEKFLLKGGKDHIHGFRSAVTAANALPKLGFAVKPAYTSQIAAWSDLTFNAICPLEQAFAQSPIEQPYQRLQSPQTIEFTQDNSKLPQIIAGIDALFEQDAALIIKAILLHMSLDVVDDYPYTAALSESEIKAYFTPELYPLIKIMMLADSDAWAYFDANLTVSWRRQTLVKYADIAQWIGL